MRCLASLICLPLWFFSISNADQDTVANTKGNDGISRIGFQVFGQMAQGWVFRGPQAHPGIITIDGDTATSDRMGGYLGMRYYPFDFFGIELATGGYWGVANAPLMNSVFFTLAWSTQAGLTSIPWQFKTSTGWLQGVVSGGMNYTRLSLAQQYRDFFKKSTGLDLRSVAASGFGWYGGCGFRFLSRFRLLGDLAAKFMDENPSFPGANQAFAGKTLDYEISLGYQL